MRGLIVDFTAALLGPATDVLASPDFALSENGHRFREVFGVGELADPLTAEPTEQAADLLGSDEVHGPDYTLTVDTRQASSRMEAMTAHRDPWISCDVCHSQQYPEDAGVFTDIDFRELRAGARENGWRYRKGVGDVCERCVQNLGPVRYGC